ncbi:hypothetical protein GGTG_00057 [Gaeumannomyces tritici R3-111a-1]|uniref:Uncharacterized protein n=1 Tax=Gaeumannomyces tritici (strain R3-111a-1) TaxID=644352 RepID=J3NFL1_GAET3|nr:hypothetical protein GGTG_00057 [Gaeumannomyces tritici R3-111a-1]EJT80051.1 hypothetical protein GGTG_00057 [Gaeumannomyces tritici R3-111a-1]
MAGATCVGASAETLLLAVRLRLHNANIASRHPYLSLREGRQRNGTIKVNPLTPSSPPRAVTDGPAAKPFAMCLLGVMFCSSFAHV